MKYNSKERCFVASNSGDRYFFAHWWGRRPTELHTINYEYIRDFPLELPTAIPLKRNAQEYDFTITTPYVCLRRGLVVHLTDDRLAIITGDPEDYEYSGIRVTLLDDNFCKKETTNISPRYIIWTVNETHWEYNPAGKDMPTQMFFIPYDCFIAKGWEVEATTKVLSKVGIISVALWFLLLSADLNLGQFGVYVFTLGVSGAVFGTIFGVIPCLTNFFNRLSNNVRPQKGKTSDAWDSYIRRRRRTN